MATVPLSKELLHRVDQNIISVCSAPHVRIAHELSDAVKLAVEALPLSVVKAWLWGQHLHLAPPAIPLSWCKTAKAISVHLEFTMTDDPLIPYRAASVHRPLLQDEVLHIPPYHDAALSMYRDAADIRLGNPVGLIPQELYDRVVELRLEHVASTRKTQELREQVSGVLKSHPSLNKALFAYPEIRPLIPQDFLDRVAQKVDRTRAKAEPTPVDAPELDRETLATTLALHTLNY
jgi:hypothetical protein